MLRRRSSLPLRPTPVLSDRPPGGADSPARSARTHGFYTWLGAAVLTLLAVHARRKRPGGCGQRGESRMSGLSEALSTEEVLHEEIKLFDKGVLIPIKQDGSFKPGAPIAITSAKNDLAALCLSGGGIRSAAFSLGILQAFARFGLLDQFHYLSTVSGGGYTGSLLLAWLQRPAEKKQPPKPANFWRPDLPVIQRLRQYQEYLTPRVGLGSPDTWAAIAYWLRCLVLNWCVLLPLIGALALVPHVFHAGIASLINQCEARLIWWRVVAVLGVPAFVGACCGVAIGGLGNCKWRAKPDSDRKFEFLLLLPVTLYAVGFTFAEALGDSNAATSLLVDWALWPGLGAAFWFLARAWTCWWFHDKTKPIKPILEMLTWIVAALVNGGWILLGSRILSPDSHLPGDWSEARLLITVGPPWAIAGLILADFVHIGGRAIFRWDPAREWFARQDGWFAATALGWMLLCWTSLYSWRQIIVAGGWTARVLLPAITLSAVLSGFSSLSSAVISSSQQRRFKFAPVVTGLSCIALLFFLSFLSTLSLAALAPWVGAPQWAVWRLGDALRAPDFCRFRSEFCINVFFRSSSSLDGPAWWACWPGLSGCFFLGGLFRFSYRPIGSRFTPSIATALCGHSLVLQTRRGHNHAPTLTTGISSTSSILKTIWASTK
jgi:hypothetical protein